MIVIKIQMLKSANKAKTFMYKKWEFLRFQNLMGNLQNVIN